jgi:hypothetical protein|tara:strand:- start:49 stop:192 length:144 start_codon:yes stop_codon:yes gene_type:complete
MDFTERQKLFDKPIVQPKKTVEQIKTDIKFLEYCIKTEGKLMGKNKK